MLDGAPAPPMTEEGMELEETAREVEQEAPVPTEPLIPSEFERLFKVCEDNPDDFNAWVTLLQYVEQEVRAFETCHSCMYEKYLHEII